MNLTFDRSNYHEPLMYQMFKIAVPHIQHYHADLGHDVLFMSNAKAGDCFMWAYRETGTSMVKIGNKDDAADIAAAHFRTSGDPIENWHFIYISKIGARAPSGHLVPLNAKTIDDLFLAWNYGLGIMKHEAMQKHAAMHNVQT